MAFQGQACVAVLKRILNHNIPFLDQLMSIVNGQLAKLFRLMVMIHLQSFDQLSIIFVVFRE